MTITAIGATKQAGATGGGISSLSVTMGSLAVGDVLVLGSVELFAGQIPKISSVSGGGVTTWQQGANSFLFNSAGYHAEVWWGVITSLTPAAVTVNYTSAGGPVSTARIACQQFHSSVAITWAVSSFGGSNSDSFGNASSGTYFNLTTGPGLLYFACGLFNSAISGASSGFAYINGIGGGTGGAVVWNLTPSGLQAPAWSQASSGPWGTCSLLLYALSATQQILII